MKKIVILFALTVVSFLLRAQQLADTLFNPPITHPAYAAGAGPVVFIDEGHHNFHTMTGRYRPFASVLQRDGYVVRPLSGLIDTNGLAPGKILVVANALHERNVEEWNLPTPSAFTAEEITSINEWVKKGGSLFLIADHMPFPGAAENLAASFGVTFYNGFARKKRNGGDDIFTVKDGGLKEGTVVSGRNQNETITSVQTFTGQAFQIPAAAIPIVMLNDEYEILLPEVAWQFNALTKTMPATNLAQVAYLKYGDGRVLISGEAAMFSAQRQGKNKFGMNARGAEQNVQLLLNIVHWLDGLIE